LKHDVWFVANVGEEGLGDLRGMRGVVERLARRCLGILFWRGWHTGMCIIARSGCGGIALRQKQRGGHSWSDYGQPSAVHELASLVTELTSIRLPREPRTTMNVGTIQGGTGINVLAAEAKCELDLRSEDPRTLAELIRQVEDHLDRCRADVKIQAEVIGERPAGEIPADHPLVKLAVDCLAEQGVNAILTTGSTDANIPLSQNIPAVVMGITTGGGAHTVGEYIDMRTDRKRD
jgi:tripeptide aminopeptidase